MSRAVRRSPVRRRSRAATGNLRAEAGGRETRERIQGAEGGCTTGRQPEFGHVNGRAGGAEGGVRSHRQVRTAERAVELVVAITEHVEGEAAPQADFVVERREHLTVRIGDLELVLADAEAQGQTVVQVPGVLDVIGLVLALETTATQTTLRFNRLAYRTGGNLRLESSSTLDDWQPLAESVAGGPTMIMSGSPATVGETGENLVQVTVTLPSTTGRRFFRLAAEP